MGDNRSNRGVQQEAADASEAGQPQSHHVVGGEAAKSDKSMQPHPKYDGGEADEAEEVQLPQHHLVGEVGEAEEPRSQAEPQLHPHLHLPPW